MEAKALKDLQLPPNKPIPTEFNAANITYQTLFQDGTYKARSLLTQFSDTHSASFLTAKPSGSTELSDEAFSTSGRLRLRLEQLPAGYKCETHNAQIDTFANHALSCQNFQGAVHARHDFIRDEPFAINVALDNHNELKLQNGAALPAVTTHLNRNEPQLEQRASSRSVPGDFALRITRDAVSRTFYDITVVNTLIDKAESSINLPGTPSENLILFLCVAQRKKIEKHGADVPKMNGYFVPLVVSTTGGAASGILDQTSRVFQIRLLLARAFRKQKAGRPFLPDWAVPWQEETN